MRESKKLTALINNIFNGNDDYFYDLIVKFIGIVLGILSFLIVFLFWYYFFSVIFKSIIEFFMNLQKIEKIFLIIFSFCFFDFDSYIFLQKQMPFILLCISDILVPYEALFTNDSGGLYITDVFTNPASVANDIKQPLFALYTLCNRNISSDDIFYIIFYS